MTARKDDCIFCRIVSGQIDCAKVYEDDDCLAFLDINPLAEGHLLLIPKTHAEMIYDLDPEQVARMARLFGRLTKAVQQATGAQGVNILQNNGRSSGQAVFHVHVHFIPRVPDDNLGYRWPAGRYKESALQTMQRKVMQAIQKEG